jgi:Lar family restriction alleviation protein
MSLRPCPSCGSDNVATVRKDIDDPSPFQVRCLDCDCRGRRAATRAEAIRHWEGLRYVVEEEAEAAGDVRHPPDVAG